MKTALLLVLPVLIVLLVLLASPASGQDVLVPRGADWTYLDDGTDPGPTWTTLAFDDSTWSAGPAHLGYGDDDEATEVGFGGDEDNKFITTYFRHEFTVAPQAWDTIRLRLVRDDGAVVYLNGIELTRNNMPAGVIASTTLAASTISGSDEDTTTVFDFLPSMLLTGDNILAVEIHQRTVTSSDISFDLQLVGGTDPWILRGPYLQIATATSMEVRWRTSIEADGRVWYGTDPRDLVLTADEVGLSIGHQINLTGLLPDTTYYYKIGTTADVLAGGDEPFSFRTAPVIGTRTPIRIWVLGDSGTGNIDAMAVRDAYAAFTGSTRTDVMLFLGDNAYDAGLDFQYTDALFDMYTDAIASTAFWPARGNHDTHTNTFTGIFSMPSAGEAGGFPSGSESYYSFDYANVHFVCLDSFLSNGAIGGPMWTWLEADLSATTQDWIIAYWHHPPYSKGSHDSDTEGLLIQMRTNFVPLLEDHGVDLVLCGHSHSYERSFLIDSHYGLSGSFDTSMLVDGGDGDPGSDGAYTTTADPHRGTVFAVPGSSGKTTGMEPMPHPVMLRSIEVLGSLVIDVDTARLTGHFVTDTGVIADVFQIEQELDGTWTSLGSALAGISGPPLLEGQGILMGDSDLLLELSTAAPSAPAWLVYGLAELNAPFMGGILVPNLGLPGGGAQLLFTDGLGAFDIPASWPPGVPRGVELLLQYWIEDATGPVGFTASNAIKATTP